MKKRILGLALTASLMTLSVGANALTVSTSVDATSNPWDITTYQAGTYGISGSTGPTSVSGGGLDFSAGSVFNISFVSGSISLGAHPSLTVTDINGIPSGHGGTTAGNSGQYFPSNSIGSSVLLGALIGTFADAGGNIVGNPFAVGTGPVFVAPAGATQLLLGINDDIFGDNSGAFQIDVSQSPAAVPVPAAVWLFGSAIVGLAGMRRKKS